MHFLGVSPPPYVDFPPGEREKDRDLGFSDYLNMTLAGHASNFEEMSNLASFAHIDVILGARFTTAGMSEEVVSALEAGMSNALCDINRRAMTLMQNAGGGRLYSTNDIGQHHEEQAARSQKSLWVCTVRGKA